MNEPWNWEKEDLTKLVGQTETMRLEFKSSRVLSDSHENIAKALSREVSAFANTEGGVIVIGMKERKEGKSRIAEELDSGVDTSKWWQERLQQVIESNVSPYLTGIRVKPVPLNEKDYSRVAYVIVVPQGSTAYQASDHKYYGRSEYECKSLPDHEVRLRMFRGQALNGAIKITDCTVREDTLRSNDAFRRLYSNQWADYEDLLDEDDLVPTSHYDFRVGLENVGEINITEFKVKLNILNSNRFMPSRFVRNMKDGWVEEVPIRGVTLNAPPQYKHIHINVYPKEVYGLTNFRVYLLPNENLQEINPILSWTLYLKDTLPIQGEINIADKLQEVR